MIVDMFQYYFWTLLAAISTALIGVGLEYIINRMVNINKFDTQTHKFKDLILINLIAQVYNTTFIYFIISSMYS